MTSAADSMQQQKIVITGGGTGGHIYPALAVIQQLQSEHGDQAITLQYVGKKKGMESEKVPPYQVPFYGITFTGMPRKITLHWVTWILQLVLATLQVTWKFLTDWHPNVVFSTGGYVTAPVLWAALLTRTPYVLHEPDAHSGLVNRLFSRWATYTTTAFEGALPHLPQSRTACTGNPIRSIIGLSDRVAQVKAFQRFFPNQTLNESEHVLLVTGGSQGAETLNKAVVKALPQFSALGVWVIHQTGAKGYADTQAWLGDTTEPKYWMSAFIDDMPTALDAADMACCRAGSLTLSEHYAAGIPTILVPYPYAAANHQLKNAQAAESAGAAVIIEDKDLTADSLLQQVKCWLILPEQLASAALSAEKLGRPKATQHIVSEILKVIS